MAPPSFDIYSDFDKNFRRQLYNQTKSLFTGTLKKISTNDDFNKKLKELDEKLKKTTFANKIQLNGDICQFTNTGMNYSENDANICYDNYINKVIDNQVAKDLLPFNDRLNTLKKNIENKFNDYELLYKLTNNNETIFDALKTLHTNMENELDDTKNNINKERHNKNIVDNNIKSSSLNRINSIMYIANIILLIVTLLLGLYILYKSKKEYIDNLIKKK
jgi:hypothetical protein